jgi:8-oxo-dGTP pyrophosphatase MutT (NUDIX family)
VTNGPIDLSAFPMKRVASGALIRDGEGRVLVVKPTYKEMWEIPGGLVEVGESPREAARRELVEELGRSIEIGALLCVHYADGSRVPGDGLNFVFDGGTTATPAGEFDLPADELAEAAFVEAGELDGYLPRVMVDRMLAAIGAAADGGTAYLER